MVRSDVKRFFLKCYKRVYRVYFGYRHSEKAKQDIKIGKATLEDLGILENINELFEEVGRGDNSK